MLLYILTYYFIINIFLYGWCVLWLGAQVANLVGRRRTLLAVASLFALAPLVSWIETASVGGMAPGCWRGSGVVGIGTDVVCFPQCRTFVLGSTACTPTACKQVFWADFDSYSRLDCSRSPGIINEPRQWPPHHPSSSF